MYQTLLFIKYFPFFKGNRFKTVILALILISGNICFAQGLNNNNFKLKEKSHQSFILNNKGFGEEYKENKNRTTFFAGAGPIMSFHPGSYGRNYISVLGGLGVNFKLSNKFYLNLETGIFKQYNETGIWLSLSPEFRLSFQNMEVFLGFGGVVGGIGGIGGAFYPNLKFNYFINDNIGAGIEIGHPTIFNYYDNIVINIGSGFIFRL